MNAAATANGASDWAADDVRTAATLHLTIGVGKKEPQGRAVEVPGTVEGLARWLNDREPEGLNTWWTFHTYRDGYRSGKNWTGAGGVAVDVDFCAWAADDPRHAAGNGKVSHDHTSPPPAELAARLESALRAGELPGNLLHATAHGFRFVFILEEPCLDAGDYAARARAAHELVRQALADLEVAGCPGVHVDELLDLGRVFWAPRGWCLGPDGNREERERDATVVVMRHEPYAAAELQVAAPEPGPHPPPAKSDPTNHVNAVDDLEAAAERYNRDHIRDLPHNSGPCPMCGKGGRFGSLPDAPHRWSCWGASHPDVGVPPSTPGSPWTGDALDLDAFERYGRTGKDHVRARAELLRAEGYLARRAERANHTPDAGPDAEPSPFVGQEQAPPARPPDLLEVDDIFAPLPPVSWLCEALDVAPGAPLLIAGYGFSGKTVCAQDLALAVASGAPAWGRFQVRRGRVLHLDYEQGKYLTRKRYQRLARARDIDQRDLAGRLVVRSMPPWYLDSVAPDELLRVCEGFDLVIVDSFRASCPATDENSSDARLPLDRLTRISDATGVTPAVIHHARKPSKDAQGGERMSVRGTGAIFDAAGSVLVFGAEKNEPIVVVPSKARISGRLHPDFRLVVEDVELDGVADAGLRVSYIEILTQKKQAAPDRHAEAKKKILEFVQAEVTTGGVNVLRARLGLRKEDVSAAVDELVREGALFRGGTLRAPTLSVQGTTCD